jgi:hypothetical protein
VWKGGLSMQCTKCKGQMILEEFLDLRDDTGRFTFHGWRCLICGEISDPVIRANRKLRMTPLNTRNRKSVVGVN